MRLCSRCRREPGIFEVRRKSYMGFWGTDCLFTLKRLYRSPAGIWSAKGYYIRRLNAEVTPKELAQTSIRTNIDKAKQAAKTRASLWRRIQMEATARATGFGSLASFQETRFIRAVVSSLVWFGYKPSQTESLINEIIARRFPGAEVKGEIVHEVENHRSA